MVHCVPLWNLSVLVTFFFPVIEKLLQLLQLLCPPNNILPQMLYEVKKFFGSISSYKGKQKYCTYCDKELEEAQWYCRSTTCNTKEPNTLITLDATKAIECS